MAPGRAGAAPRAGPERARQAPRPSREFGRTESAIMTAMRILPLMPRTRRAHRELTAVVRPPGRRGEALPAVPALRRRAPPRARVEPEHETRGSTRALSGPSVCRSPPRQPDRLRPHTLRRRLHS
jgi:hypothetical protein